MKLMNSMPNYIQKRLKYFAASLVIVTLSACTPPSDVKNDSPENRQEVKANQTKPIYAKKNVSLSDLKRLRNTAADQGDWEQYLIHSEAIWHQVPANEQAQIENQAWGIVRSLSAFERNKLNASYDANVRAWQSLYSYIQGINQHNQQALLNLQTFDKEAIFNKHLLPKLMAQTPAKQSVTKIAVLLPMQGKYQVVSEHIRNGITKAYFATGQATTLEFYDSSDLNELEFIYTQAKQSGADRIIGPLRKEAVQQLASFHDKSMLALNTTETASIPQFNFKSADPTQQMIARFTQQNYQRIGIMTNDNPRNIAEAKTLQSKWQEATGGYAEVSIYPNTNPKLREALGALIHEDQSQARKNNLNWALNAQLSFFPRTRGDLDAVVIFDNTQRLAVFRPQFDFFGLDTPLYGNNKLSPKAFLNQLPNRDLKDIHFLSYPAVVSPQGLNNAFEAFGWDSYQLSIHFDKMLNGACLTGGKTGILHLENMKVKQQHVWIKYNRHGILEDAPLVVIPPKIVSTQTKPE